MKTKIILSAVVGLFMSGCAPTVVSINSEFNAQEAEWFLEEGNNTIKGSALLRQAGGGVITCAGNDVAIKPYTEYGSERITALYGNNVNGFKNIIRRIKLEEAPQQYWKFGKGKPCNAQGFFEFNNLPDGTYFITTTIVWSITQHRKSGGSLMQKVEVSGGETKEIVLSR